MKSQRWMTTLIGIAMLGIIAALVIVGGMYLWQNTNIGTMTTARPEAELTVTGTDEASDTDTPDDNPASVGGDSEESTGSTPTPNPTATPTGTLPPTVTPLPPATDTPVPVVPTDTAVPPTDPPPNGNEDFISYDDNQALLNLVNQERCTQGLSPVIYNKLLYITALEHSVDMLQNDFFDHQGSDGTQVEDRATAWGYSWLTIGENIAVGQIDVDQVYEAWMDSPGHRENILRPEFREMALAHIFREVSTYGHYWTQVFGSTGTDPISCAEAGF